jgi:2-polyprenyl-3-methyl-5-hydroxy-6-metoxy-1,4-benzoquinol methylase
MSQFTIETFIQQPEQILRLQKWIFATIQPYLKGRVLELQSGAGTFSSLLAEQNIPHHLSETDGINRDSLDRKFQGNSMIRAIHNIDLRKPDFQSEYSRMLGVFSTIIAVNVTDHQFADKTIIENVHSLLKQRGHLIMTTPSSTVLYPGTAEDLESIQLQNRARLKLLFRDFQILKTRYFNVEIVVENVPAFRSVGLSTLVISQRN